MIWIAGGSGPITSMPLQVHQLAQLLEAELDLAARHQGANGHAGRREDHPVLDLGGNAPALEERGERHATGSGGTADAARGQHRPPDRLFRADLRARCARFGPRRRCPNGPDRPCFPRRCGRRRSACRSRPTRAPPRRRVRPSPRAWRHPPRRPTRKRPRGRTAARTQAAELREHLAGRHRRDAVDLRRIGSAHCFSILAFATTSFHLAISFVSSAPSSSGVPPWANDAELVEALLDLGKCEHRVDLLVEKIDHRPRRFRRRGDAVPGGDLVTGHAALDHGRHAGQTREAALRRNRDRTQAAALHLRHDRRENLEAELDDRRP